jgi:hypothetical protein
MKAGSFEPYKIFEFGKIELSQDDIAKIAPRHLRFMGQSCLAANDISVFLKIILGHLHIEGPDEILTQMPSLTRIILQRQLQAKIFEFIEMMDAYLKVCGRKSDKVLGNVLDEIPASLAEIKANPCYELAKKIRIEITNHYGFRDWHEGARRQSNGYNFNLYMHKSNGNSFFPFAEDASHLSLFEESEFANITYEQSFKWMANSNKE